MSRHHKERDEKICLNCNAATYGRYCHVCGQENIETTESFWHLLQHFVFDLFHFDGKFWVSLKYLLFKPGFLAKEYIRGRRASYLHPIRMYIFINTIFFLIFFTFYNTDVSKEKIIVKPTTAKKKIEKLEKYKAGVERRLKDSLQQFRRAEFLNFIELLNTDIAAITKDSTKANTPLPSDIVDTSGLTINNEYMRTYTSFEQYDSFQAKQPKNKRDGYIKRYINKFELEQRQANREGKQKEFWNKIFDKFLHSIPKILFISMPFFALVLMILYARNKKYFYVHHIIFTLYFYCGLFMLNLLNLWGDSISKFFTHKPMSGFFYVIFTIAYLFYNYKSFRKFFIY